MDVDENYRLTSIDEWGDRKFIIPASVKGPWRKRRTIVQWVLLVVFLLAPWLKVDGLQLIWLDIPARRFTVLGQVFLAHDAPLIFLLAGIAVLLLALATALWGRVWCGWACPQTVFIDGLYRQIEEWIEGNYQERRRMRAAPMSPRKLTKRILKWSAYIFVSSIVAHSFIAYFAGAGPLVEMSQRTPGENWGYFLLVSLLTGILAFNFGWFREQFCLIMCPYGRFQAVLMDEDSVTVTYDSARGEPRKGSVRGQKLGDCVSCNRCVDVCPTAIDIRNGTQMECIGCTACVDACNEIMARVKRPPNLIGYQSQRGKGMNFRRPRVIALSTLLFVMTVALGFSVARRDDFYVSVLRATGMPYQILPDQKLSNHFKLHIQNQSQTTQVLEIQIPPGAKEKGVELAIGQSAHELKPGESKEVHLFVTFPNHLVSLKGEFDLSAQIRESKTETLKPLDFKLVGPKN